jgi:predicted RNA-binding protein with PIN domain
VRNVSSIIVDGYNLIGISHDDLAKQREDLVRLLSAYKRLKGHDIVLVFDGWKSGGFKEEISRTGGITVIYSKLGEKADSVIKRIVGGENKEWIVVSSDREVTSYAWSHGSVPVASERFYSHLESAGGALAGEYDPLYEEDIAASRKGSSRTPSRKEKALLRILKKL